MNILVTGGTGYIGTSLVDKLNAHPEVEKIIVYDNMSQNNARFFFGNVKLAKVKFVSGDILNHFELNRHLDGVDVVFHLAGVVKSPYSLEDSLKYEQINQWGTANLVQCVENFDSIRQFIFLSSASVYGFSGIENELLEVNPMNAYGRSKREAEKFAELLAPEMTVDILRAGNVFGYNRTVRLDSVINRFIFEALSYGRIRIFGNGNQVRPFVHISGLVEAMIQTLGTQEQPGSVRVRNSIDFHLSINDLRDIMLGEIDDLEYLYVNQSYEAPSLQITLEKPLSRPEINKILKDEILTFKNRFILI